MLKVILSGSGKMGRQVLNKIEETADIECKGVVTSGTQQLPGSPMLAATPELLEPVDDNMHVIIDFSLPDRIETIGEYAKQNSIPMVIATTGYNEEQIQYIRELATEIPIVYSANLSMGITVMADVLKQIMSMLPDSFDIEIIEKHHNQKADAPSGTAKMLAEAIDPGDRYLKKYGRGGNGKRGNEIGIHAVRGGGIAGEHTVIFAGENEVLEVTHRASSRQIFADGAIQAARFIVSQTPGLYSMADVLNSKV